MFVDNAINSEGAEKLAGFLRENGTLQDLRLWSNDLADQGAKILAEALALNSSLRKLDIGRNGIYAAGAMALAAGMSKNMGIRELNIEENRIEENDFTQFALNLTSHNLCELKARSEHLPHLAISSLGFFASTPLFVCFLLKTMRERSRQSWCSKSEKTGRQSRTPVRSS